LKKLEIRNIFFNDVEKLFDSTIAKAAEEVGVDAEVIWDKLKDQYEEIIGQFDDKIVDFYVDHNKFSLDTFLETHKKNQDTIVSLNSNSFKFFITYINACQIVYQKSFEDIENKEVSKNIKICISIYGLIIRKAEQIVSILIDGYIDAAMIIWRSLYENSIALITLLEENDNELAKKFIDHSFRNSKKKIVSYRKNHEELKFGPVPPKVEEDLEVEEKRIKELYGNEFIKNEFGWANDLIPGKQKASLYLLEERVKLNKYRPFYLMCCEHTHLGFNAFNNYMENGGVILPRILSQATELKSFIDPMQFSISLLHQVSELFLYNVSIPQEYGINVKLLKRISKDFIETFSESTQDEEE
jgi:hypothetical protein